MPCSKSSPVPPRSIPSLVLAPETLGSRTLVCTPTMSGGQWGGKQGPQQPQATGKGGKRAGAPLGAPEGVVNLALGMGMLERERGPSRLPFPSALSRGIPSRENHGG